jgi:hypothetical protein
VYKGCNWYELQDERSLDLAAIDRARTTIMRKKAQIGGMRSQIIKQAEERAVNAGSGTNKERLGGIRINRADERQHEREKFVQGMYGDDTLIFEENPKGNRENGQPSESGYVQPFSHHEYLMKKLSSEDNNE